MSQRQWVVIIGVWVMLFLFLGFPSSWDKVMALLTGVLIIVFAYRIRFQEAPRHGQTFSDSRPTASAPVSRQPAAPIAPEAEPVAQDTASAVDETATTPQS